MRHERGEDAELLGAAELAFERLLADPLEVATGGAGEPDVADPDAGR